MAKAKNISGIRPIESVAADRLLSAPGRQPVRRKARLEIGDGVIAAVTDGDALEADVGGPGTLVIPGLANAHDHGRGLRRLAYGATDAALEVWLPQLAATHPVVDPYVIHAVAFARMAQAGMTSVVHCHVPQRWDNIVDEALETCRAAREVGIRLAFVVPMRDINWLAYGGDHRLLDDVADSDRDAIRDRWLGSPPPLKDQIELVRAVADACEDETVQVQLGPYGDVWASEELLELVAEESSRTGRRVHMHCLETRLQREWVDAEYGSQFIQRLDRIGFLSPRLTLAHGVWLRPEECEVLAGRGVTISVNTSSNLRLRSGIAPVADFVAKKLPIAIGLDGLSLDDDDDMLREMRLAYLLHAGISLDETLTPDRLFTAVSTAGAWAANGKDGFGELAPGCPADLVVLDYDALAHDVVHDLTGEIELVLGRATMRNVMSVVANGREIVREGRAIGVDLDQLNAELFAQASRGIEDKMEILPLLRRYQDAIRKYYNAGRHREIT